MTANESFDFESFIGRTLDLIDRDTRKRLKRIPLNDSARTTYAVIGGLLVRQRDLTAVLVRNSLNWNQVVAPLVHRAMAEVRITLGYLLVEDTNNRCQAYIQYSLGQEKLQIEHYEALVEDGDCSPTVSKQIESRSAWLSLQQHSWLTTVNLGAQFERPVRSIAIDANLKDLYDFNYSPFSSAVHSTWQYVGKNCVYLCQEPLHGFHFFPEIRENTSHPFEAAVAVKNFDYTLKAIDAWLGKNLKGEARSHFEKKMPLHGLAAHVQQQASEIEQ